MLYGLFFKVEPDPSTLRQVWTPCTGHDPLNKTTSIIKSLLFKALLFYKSSDTKQKL